MTHASGSPFAPTRNLRGFPLKSFGVLCAVAAFYTADGIVMQYLAGKPPADAPAVLKSFATTFICFGAIWAAVVVAGIRAPRRTGPRIATLAGAVVLGLVAGKLLNHLWLDMPTLLKQLSFTLFWTHVIAAGVLVYYFFVREEEALARLHADHMRREALDREFVEARLLVMQSQIEPHFLFNTLANVRRLFQTDPPAAQAMLAHLSRYLGALLPRMRQSDSTLGHELMLAQAYLSVQQIRMGSRLRVQSDVPDVLHGFALPPMMLVTLVENAIRHGLTPLAEGGDVRISARRNGGRLRIAVADTGAGLSESSGSGVGLANIRTRLSTLYDGNARLLLAANAPRGVVATIELPAVEAARHTLAA